MNTLLHICCAPCSNMCIETLRGDHIDVTGYWYNPNIHQMCIRDRIDFKTDNEKLFAFSLEEFAASGYRLDHVTDDLHANGPQGIMTGYEEKFYELGTPIHRCEAVVLERPAEADVPPKPGIPPEAAPEPEAE